MPAATRRGRAHRDLHADDQAARQRLAAQLKFARQATGISQLTLRGVLGFDVIDRENRADWYMDSLQEWAKSLSFTLNWRLDKLMVDPAIMVVESGETAEEERLRMKAAVINARTNAGYPTTWLDEALEQSLSIHWGWENRGSNFYVANIQRIVRAMGGVFVMELEHDRNFGIDKRLRRTQG